MFKDKVVIITGAGKGIGKDTASQFAAQGAKVVIASRSPDELKEVAESLRASGGEVLAQPTDISQPEQVEELVAVTLEHYGQIDILINNAAVAGVAGRMSVSLVDMPIEDWDFVHGVNLRGTMLCCKAVLPNMIERRSGAILIVSSEAGRRGLAGKTHYCSSKSGHFGLTRALAWDVGQYGIRVNCVVPGAIATELLVNYHHRIAAEQGVSYEEIVSQAGQSSPEGRLVTPSEVTDVLMYLASDRASAVTGQTLDVGAGSWPG
jgi:NAD(P)-dependent dehydrogenase (short-subunit alcohol dehydrogenase family)